MSVSWSDEVDEILAGDLAAGFAYLTPAKGVVITPMAPLEQRDREAGTVTLTTSLGGRTARATSTATTTGLTRASTITRRGTYVRPGTMPRNYTHAA